MTLSQLHLHTKSLPQTWDHLRVREEPTEGLFSNMRESRVDILITSTRSTSRSQSTTKSRKVKKVLLPQLIPRSKPWLPLTDFWETSVSHSTPSTNPKKMMRDRKSLRSTILRLRLFSVPRQSLKSSRKHLRQKMLRAPSLNFQTKFQRHWPRA